MATDNTRAREREAAMKKAKKSKRRRRRKQTIAVTLIILLITAVVLCSLSLTVFFKIKTINVTGFKIYSQEEIIKASNVNLEDNLIRLSEKNIAKKLEKELPFIVGVELKRHFPETLEIIVTETVESVCIYSNESYYTADMNGKVISKLDEQPENLINLKLSNDIALSVGENIEFSSEREEELFNLYFKMAESANFKVNAVNISDPYSSYMKIEDRIIVKLGSGTYFSEKIDYLKAGISNLSKDAVGVFDLSAWTPENNQPVFTYSNISEFEL